MADPKSNEELAKEQSTASKIASAAADAAKAVGKSALNSIGEQMDENLGASKEKDDEKKGQQQNDPVTPKPSKQQDTSNKSDNPRMQMVEDLRKMVAQFNQDIYGRVYKIVDDFVEARILNPTTQFVANQKDKAVDGVKSMWEGTKKGAANAVDKISNAFSEQASPPESEKQERSVTREIADDPFLVDDLDVGEKKKSLPQPTIELSATKKDTLGSDATQAIGALPASSFAQQPTPSSSSSSNPQLEKEEERHLTI